MSDVNRNVYFCKLFDCYDGILNDRQREILSLHYDDDLSLSEIAEQCEISKQGVSQCLKKAEETVMELENTLHLLEKQEKLEEICKQLESKDSEFCKEMAAKIREEVL